MARMKDEGVLLSTTVWPTKLRAVTHLDVCDDDIDAAIDAVPRALGILARLGASRPRFAERSRKRRAKRHRSSLRSCARARSSGRTRSASRRRGRRTATPDHADQTITKTFTAVAVMQLRAENKLDLEETLDRYLPVRAHGTLTIRRMLAHASGLQREVPGEVWETLEFPRSTDELLGKLEEAELVLAPGERWHYSNLAYTLLGEVVARLSGMPYEEYVEQRVLEPLGLTRTSFSPVAPTAIAYSTEPYTDVVHREPMMVERKGGIAAAVNCRHGSRPPLGAFLPERIPTFSTARST
jgi:hypothetical protein